MRYVMAAVFSLLVLAGGVGWCRHARQSFLHTMRAEFERAKAAGELPPEKKNLDFETVSKQGFGIELPRSLLMELSIADLFWKYWFVFVLLVCGVSFGVAHWMSPKTPFQESRR